MWSEQTGSRERTIQSQGRYGKQPLNPPPTGSRNSDPTRCAPGAIPWEICICLLAAYWSLDHQVEVDNLGWHTLLRWVGWAVPQEPSLSSMREMGESRQLLSVSK